MDEIKLENRLTRLEENVDVMGEEIVELQDKNEQIEKLALSVNSLAIEVRHLVEGQCGIAERLVRIESKPGQRWDNLVGTILTVLASGIAGYLLSHFLQ